MTTTQPLPMLYGALDLLDRDRHRTLRIAPPTNLEFTARSHVFPLNATEFRRASRDFPIVFLRVGSRPVSVMVTSRAPGSNGGLGADLQWRAGMYVPAYIRRYPFILVQYESGQKIGFDPDAPHFLNEGGEPIFPSGSDGGALARIQSFCGAFDLAARETEAFSFSLDENKLLLPAQTSISVSGVQDIVVDGFEVVDEARLRALNPETLADWLRRGWLSFIESHHASLDRWADMVSRS